MSRENARDLAFDANVSVSFPPQTSASGHKATLRRSRCTSGWFADCAFLL